MPWFRFATTVLVGPWRATRKEALSDAVRARQAVPNPSLPDGLEWSVSGRIESTKRDSGSGKPHSRLAR